MHKLTGTGSWSDIKLEAQWAESVSLTFHSVFRKINTEPFMGASYQISINLAKWFNRRFFLIGQWQTRTAYGSHGNFVQAKQFQRRRFLEIDQPETRIAYGGHVC
jgi:hypothetical protein